MLIDSVAKPHETDQGRLRALYRLPGPHGAMRTLEVCTPLTPPVLAADWPGAKHAVLMLGELERVEEGCDFGLGSEAKQARFDAPFPYSPRSFDFVVMHGTLDALPAMEGKRSGRFDLDEFMTKLIEVLVPGGIIAGCVGNRNDPRRLVTWLKGRFGGGHRILPARFTIRGCDTFLKNAGLTDVRLHSVLPHADSPLKIVEVQRYVAYDAFRRELDARSSEIGLSRYLLRRAILESGLYPSLERSIFFWGYRPC